MLDRYIAQGRHDALAKFAVEAPPGMLAGLLGKAKSFGSGQWGALKGLGGNLRGGFGGASNLGNIGQLAEGAAGPTADVGQIHRQRALGNLKTLAPSLLAGGGLYMLHRHNQAQREQDARQQGIPSGYISTAGMPHGLLGNPGMPAGY